MSWESKGEATLESLCSLLVGLPCFYHLHAAEHSTSKRPYISHISPITLTADGLLLFVANPRGIILSTEGSSAGGELLETGVHPQ